MGSGLWATNPSLPGEKMIPKAGWKEYAQWLSGRRRRFVVRENSMVPTLMPGDTVLAEMSETVQVGDIAIVRWSGFMGPRVLIEQRPSQGDAISGASPLLLIKRVGEIFCDGGVYLISDNAKEPCARDSRHFGVIDSNQVIGYVTSRLASSL